MSQPAAETAPIAEWISSLARHFFQKLTDPVLMLAGPASIISVAFLFGGHSATLAAASVNSTAAAAALIHLDTIPGRMLVASIIASVTWMLSLHLSGQDRVRLWVIYAVGLVVVLVNGVLLANTYENMETDFGQWFVALLWALLHFVVWFVFAGRDSFVVLQQANAPVQQQHPSSWLLAQNHVRQLQDHLGYLPVRVLEREWQAAVARYPLHESVIGHHNAVRAHMLRAVEKLQEPHRPPSPRRRQSTATAS
jgi:hypothetical protein